MGIAAEKYHAVTMLYDFETPLEHFPEKWTPVFR
jgi:hypothetical protein